MGTCSGRKGLAECLCIIMSPWPRAVWFLEIWQHQSFCILWKVQHLVSNLVRGKSTEGRGHNPITFKTNSETLAVSPARGVNCMVFIIDPSSVSPPFLCSLAGPSRAAMRQRHESSALCAIWQQHTAPICPQGPSAVWPLLCAPALSAGQWLGFAHMNYLWKDRRLSKMQSKGHQITTNRAFDFTSCGRSNDSSPSCLCFPFLSYWHIFPFAARFDSCC